jgi:hypothetical protein
VVIESFDDFKPLEEMIVPTLVAVVLAAVTTYLANKNPSPQTENVDPTPPRTAGDDFVKGATP